MCHALRGWLPLVACLAFTPDVRAAEDLDQYEERAAVRCAERVAKANKGERGHWIATLEVAFPDKVVHATTEDEYATWFALLAGKNEEWRRDDSPSPAVTELFEKVVGRLELGPVPSVRRDEFMKYAKKLMKDQPRPDEKTDPHEDADKVFRALDRDGDAELARDEFTAGLKEEKGRADLDGNGRITKEEYREYFARKVAVKVEAMASATKGEARGPDGKPGKPGAKLPDWFAALDENKDGQVALYEWRKAGRPLAAYSEMDLNGDGLLTRDEYLRYVKMNEQKEAEKKREEEARRDK